MEDSLSLRAPRSFGGRSNLKNKILRTIALIVAIVFTAESVLLAAPKQTYEVCNYKPRRFVNLRAVRDVESEKESVEQLVAAKELEVPEDLGARANRRRTRESRAHFYRQLTIVGNKVFGEKDYEERFEAIERIVARAECADTEEKSVRFYTGAQEQLEGLVSDIKIAESRAFRKSGYRRQAEKLVLRNRGKQQVEPILDELGALFNAMHRSSRFSDEEYRREQFFLAVETILNSYGDLPLSHLRVVIENSAALVANDVSHIDFYTSVPQAAYEVSQGQFESFREVADVLREHFADLGALNVGGRRPLVGEFKKEIVYKAEKFDSAKDLLKQREIG